MQEAEANLQATSAAAMRTATSSRPRREQQQRVLVPSRLGLLGALTEPSGFDGE